MMAQATKPTDVGQGGLPVWEGEFAAFAVNDMADILAENTGGEGMRPTDLTRVTFPKEGAMWTLDDPSTSSGVRSVDELAGVVVMQRVLRQFYQSGYEAGSTDAPDCMSTDGEFGAPSVDEPYVQLPDGTTAHYGGDCSMCPLNQWDSDLKGGKGKACREYRMIALLEPSAPFPIMVRIPPTQLGLWHRFGVDMAKMGLRLSRTVVGLALTMGRDKKPALSPYVKGVLPPEIAVQIEAVREDMKLLAERSPEPVALAEPDALPFTDEDQGPF